MAGGVRGMAGMRERNGRDAGRVLPCGLRGGLQAAFKPKKKFVTICLGVDFNEDIFAYFPFFLVAFKQKPPLNH